TRQKFHVRIGQLDKVLNQVRKGEISLDANQARQLMRERMDAQSVLDGSKSFDEYEKVYAEASSGTSVKSGQAAGEAPIEKTPPAVTQSPGVSDVKNPVVRVMNKVFSPISNLPSNTKSALREAGDGRNLAKVMRVNTLNRIRQAAK